MAINKEDRKNITKEKYIYLDEYNIMHCVSKKSEFKEYNYIDYDGEGLYGFPVVGDNDVVVYSDTECYINGNKGEGKRLRTAEAYPELSRIWIELKKMKQ